MVLQVEFFSLYVGDVFPTFDADTRPRHRRLDLARRVRGRGGRQSPLIVYGSYTDEFVRTADGWRISRRQDRPAMQVPAGGRRGDLKVTYRVVHLGTGNAGKLALRGILAQPDLELVGLHAYTPEKIGRDAGELAGSTRSACTATGDLDALLSVDADCLCYMGDGLQAPVPAVETMARFLGAGRNVVTTSVLALVNPATAAAELRDPIDAACRAGGTTFYCNGADPGFASDLVPVTLLSLMDDVRRGPRSRRSSTTASTTRSRRCASSSASVRPPATTPRCSAVAP